MNKFRDELKRLDQFFRIFPLIDILVGISMLLLLGVIKNQNSSMKEVLVLENLPYKDFAFGWLGVLVSIGAYGLIILSVLKIIVFFMNRRQLK